MPEIVVHHLENSRSIRALWMLEELGLDYAIREYKRNPKTLRAPPELREIHPLGKSPVVAVDGEVLAESGAILEELVERFGEGRLRPSEPGDLSRYRYFLHYAEGSFLPPLMVQLVTSRIRKAPVPFFIKPITGRIAGEVDKSYTRPEVARHLAFLEGELTDREWLAGPELSAADIQVFYPADAVQKAKGLDGQPAIGAWLDRCRARPAYQRAVERGGDNAGFDRG